ncbi:hypothetical protein V6N13_146722 [Hibiscus sabdariffa]
MEYWFEDIDTVDNFLSKKKLKIWLNIEGLPLFAWHATVIESIAKKWGHVVKIDDDTLVRNIFDVARVLIGVTSVSDVHNAAIVTLNGDKSNIRMSTTEFKDSRCWINEERLSSSTDEVKSCRFEDTPKEALAPP